MSIRMSAALLFTSLTLCTSGAKAEDVENSEITKTIEEYCTSISDLAAERRAARQASALKELQAKVESRIDELEQHTRGLAEVIQKREALRALAEKELVDIYSGVEAEAAAAQLERLDLPLASSVLRQLKPRQASAILNVMKPDLAAQLVRLIAVDASQERVTQ